MEEHTTPEDNELDPPRIAYEKVISINVLVGNSI